MCLARERGADKSLEEEKWTCPRIKNARRSILAENKARLSEQQQQEEEEHVWMCVDAQHSRRGLGFGERLSAGSKAAAVGCHLEVYGCTLNLFFHI